MLKEITDSDPLYPSAPEVRAFVLKHLENIPKMSIKDPTLNVRSIPLAVEQVITVANVGIIVRAASIANSEYPDEIKDKVSLSIGQRPWEWNKFVKFAEEEKRSLSLVHGYFCLRTYLKDQTKK